MTASGWEFTADEVPDMPKLRKLLAQPSPFAQALDPLGRTVSDDVTLAGTTTRRDARPYNLSDEEIAEHGKQVQG